MRFSRATNSSFLDGGHWFGAEEAFSGRSSFIGEQTDWSRQRRGNGGAECKHHWQSHEICISYRCMFGMEALAVNETHTACNTGPLHCKQSMLRPWRTILIHPALTSQLPSPLAPRLKVKIENDAVFEDGDEQHDAEPGQHAEVLQDKVTQLAALVVLAVPVEHFRQL